MSDTIPTPETNAAERLRSEPESVSADLARSLERRLAVATEALAECNRTEPLKRGELKALREENATLRARLAELEKIAERLDQPRHHPPFHEVCACDCCNAHRDLAKWKEKGTK